MLACHFVGKGRYFEFPFWAAVLALGWFFPQAVGGWLNTADFPAGAYAGSMFFAALCTLALWIGFDVSARKVPAKPSWLDAPFDIRKLHAAGALLCAIGFFFQYKLSSLPDEVTSQTQWSGAAVKYLFLSNIFVFGFITLWLVYLSRKKLFAPSLLVFIIPSLALLAEAAVLRGRRAAMMNLLSYVAASLWFVRRIAVPRWMLVTGLSLGLVLINAIGIYRSIMAEEGVPFSERLAQIRESGLAESAGGVLKESGHEFRNYIYYRQVYAENGGFDFGAAHWNELVFNYVPAQIVGRGLKNALMFPVHDHIALAEEKFGFAFGVGTTSTGYTDSFASFGWFGFVKYLLIGAIMGTLYRHAMLGSFLPQLLYVYSLGTAMHAISHGTNAILLSLWIYFLALGYPSLFLARAKRDGELLQGAQQPC